MSIRVRFAPSPTGFLHVGGARTALYNFLFAKANGGKFIYRIEDTDLDRSTEESLRMQIRDMQWLGLKWDEGPDAQSLKDQGSLGPYRQSVRKEIYRKHAEDLISSGHGFYCFLTDQELAELKNEEDENFQLRSPYRDLPVEEARKRIKEGAPFTVRFKTPLAERKFILKDLVRGEVELPSSMVGDFVLIRSNGMPVYNYCCVVDDALMQITHVLRAEEHLNNTLRQVMIYEAFGWKAPEFGHLSIILGPDKKKLSKRHGATSCNDYFERGFLPAAVKNYIALLGWSHPEGLEIFEVDKLANKFTLDRMTASPAVFDEVKLRWVNSQHLKLKDVATLTREAAEHLRQRQQEFPSMEWLEKIVKILQPRLEIYDDVAAFVRKISAGGFQLEGGVEEIWTFPTTDKLLAAWGDELKKVGEYAPGDFVAKFMELAKTQLQIKGKPLFMPLRVAVIGQAHGVEIQDLVPLMKKSELLARLEIVLRKK